jgi:S-adenosylmethionine uptake transporter
MTFTLTHPTRRGLIAGPLYMIAAGALFAGSNSAVQAAGMLHGIPSPTIAFWQYAVAAILVLPVVLGQRGRTARPVAHLIRAGLAVIGVQFWVAGLAQVPIWQAIALILTSPLFVSLGAMLILGEPWSARRLVAVLAGGVGGVIILAPWSDAFTVAALFPVVAAAFWAASSLMTKALSRVEDAGSLTLWLLLLLVPMNGLAAAGTGFALVGSGVWLVLVAGALTALAQFALALAYRSAEASYLQPFDHLKLPLNVAFGIAFFGFAPPGSMWLGAAIILVATGWLMRDEAAR